MPDLQTDQHGSRDCLRLLVESSFKQIEETNSVLAKCLILPRGEIIPSVKSLLRESFVVDPLNSFSTVRTESIDEDAAASSNILDGDHTDTSMQRVTLKEFKIIDDAQSDELALSVEKFESFTEKNDKRNVLNVDVQEDGKQLVLPCKVKIIFKTLRNLNVETMNLDAELTILTWVGFDGLSNKNEDTKKKLKVIKHHVQCFPEGTKVPIDPETGEEDTDIAALPPGGLKFRINEKEYKMSAFSPNVVMPKEGADEQTAAVTSRGTFSFNFFDRSLTLSELVRYPFDVTPVTLKYELTSFQVKPPAESKSKAFKVRMNVYNHRTIHGSDGRVESIGKLVSFKTTADKLPEYNIDLSHTCVWFESENKLVERTGKYIKYYPTMVVQIRLFRDPGFALLSMVLPLLTLSLITILFLYVDGVNFYAEKVNNLSTQMLATFTYLLFVRTRLPPISKLTNIDVLIAGNIFMIVVVIMQTMWEGAFFFKRFEVDNTDERTTCGEMSKRPFPYWLFAFMVCGQSHDWNQNGDNIDDFYQYEYEQRDIGDNQRPFFAAIFGTWMFMVSYIGVKSYYFYFYQRPRYNLEKERKQRRNWKRLFENIFFLGSDRKQAS